MDLQCANCTAPPACRLPGSGKGWCRDCGKCPVCGDRLAFRVTWVCRDGLTLCGDYCAAHAAPPGCHCSAGMVPSLEAYVWAAPA